MKSSILFNILVVITAMFLSERAGATVEVRYRNSSGGLIALETYANGQSITSLSRTTLVCITST